MTLVRCGVRPTALVRRAHAPCAGPPDRSAQRQHAWLAPQCADRLRRRSGMEVAARKSVYEPCRRRRCRRRRRQGSVRAASAKRFGSRCANSEIRARRHLACAQRVRTPTHAVQRSLRGTCVAGSMADSQRTIRRVHRLLSSGTEPRCQWPEVRRNHRHLLQLPVYRADRRPHFFDEALPLLQLCTRLTRLPRPIRSDESALNLTESSRSSARRGSGVHTCPHSAEADLIERH